MCLIEEVQHFDGILKTKRFSFQSDEEIVRRLMTELVENFTENWQEDRSEGRIGFPSTIEVGSTQNALQSL